jgi:AraC-like DNA-binding protein
VTKITILLDLCGLKCTHCNKAQLLELFCPVHQLAQLVGDTRVGRELKLAMEERRLLYIYHPMTPCIHLAMMSLRQALEESDTGIAPLVLARTLEMLWLFTRAGNSATCNPISTETRKAIEKARDNIESHLADPPGLEKLAAEVGMSLSKLKQVFPKIYCMPPYSYLRHMRMERAMKLLSQKGMSVTDAALEVGYNNLSHFSKVFTTHFGIKPSKISFKINNLITNPTFGFKR